MHEHDTSDGEIVVWDLRRSLEADILPFDGVISINQTDQKVTLLQATAERSFSHITLTFDDITRHTPGFRMPDLADVRLALAFGKQHREKKLMIHCRRGVSRSTAIATAILADRYGPGEEIKAVQRIMSSVELYDPNRAVVALADIILDRGGALVTAVVECMLKPRHEMVANSGSIQP